MLAGQVEVDGEVVTRLGTKVDPTHRGDPGRRASGCRRSAPHVYLVLNKPRGVVSTMSDPEGRPHPRRTSSPTGPSGSSTSAGSTPTPTG